MAITVGQQLSEDWWLAVMMILGKGNKNKYFKHKKPLLFIPLFRGHENIEGTITCYYGRELFEFELYWCYKFFPLHWKF